MAYERASATLEQAIDQTRRLQRWLFGRRGPAPTGKISPTSRTTQTGAPKEYYPRPDERERESAVSGPQGYYGRRGRGGTVLSEGTLDEALRQAETAASQAEQMGFRPAAVSALEVQVRILLRLNRPADAVALADEALRAAEEMHYLPMVWRLSAAQAQALTRLGNTAEAAASLSGSRGGYPTARGDHLGCGAQTRFLSSPLYRLLWLRHTRGHVARRSKRCNSDQASQRKSACRHGEYAISGS